MDALPALPWTPATAVPGLSPAARRTSAAGVAAAQEVIDLPAAATAEALMPSLVLNSETAVRLQARQAFYANGSLFRDGSPALGRVVKVKV